MSLLSQKEVEEEEEEVDSDGDHQEGLHTHVYTCGLLLPWLRA